VAMDSETISVRTRRGVEVIDRANVVAAKEVPPKATRRGAPHLAISMEDLERIMVDGWPPLERAGLGDWILRASAGFTGRANSVLPLGSPGLPLSEAVERCERWHDERGLRRLFALFGPAGFAVAQDPLARELLGRGYEPFNRTAILTAATGALSPEPADAAGVRVRLESAPSPGWWDAWAALDDRTHGAETTLAAARAVLTGSPDQVFASVEVDGAAAGVARGAFAHAWAGVSALRVAPEHRRAGVARQLVGALADAARARGIRSVYLQVLHSNTPARSLFQQLGFSAHHEYCYLGARR
jgi:N-acetylglutamate synthase